jgi:hypothetical protein
MTKSSRCKVYEHMEITWYKDQVTTPPISYNSYYLDVLDSRYTSGYARPDQTEQEAEHRAATGRQRLEVRGAALDGPRPAGPVPVDDDLRLDVPEQPTSRLGSSHGG